MSASGGEKGPCEVIAVVGHPDLTAPTLKMVEEELRRRLAEFARAARPGWCGPGRDCRSPSAGPPEPRGSHW